MTTLPVTLTKPVTGLSYHYSNATAARASLLALAAGSRGRRHWRPRSDKIINVMPLLDQVQKDMVQAMKAREEARLSALRLIKAALKKHEIDSMKPLEEASELQVLNSLIKQRREAAEAFRKGGRVEQAEKEEAEEKLIESYMPAPATEAEMAAAIAAALAGTGITSLKQMGQVMNAAKARLAGKRIDGKLLSDKVRAKLS